MKKAIKKTILTASLVVSSLASWGVESHICFQNDTGKQIPFNAAPWNDQKEFSGFEGTGNPGQLNIESSIQPGETRCAWLEVYLDTEYAPQVNALFQVTGSSKYPEVFQYVWNHGEAPKAGWYISNDNNPDMAFVGDPTTNDQGYTRGYTCTDGGGENCSLFHIVNTDRTMVRSRVETTSSALPNSVHAQVGVTEDEHIINQLQNISAQQLHNQVVSPW